MEQWIYSPSKIRVISYLSYQISAEFLWRGTLYYYVYETYLLHLINSTTLISLRQYMT